MFRKFNAQIYFNKINMYSEIKRKRSMISDRILYNNIIVMEKNSNLASRTVPQLYWNQYQSMGF